MVANWIIGIVFAVASCICSNIGIQIQKIAHSTIAAWKEARDLEDNLVTNRYPRGNYLFHPLWICGLAIQGLGNALDVLALNYAPQTIIGPVGALTLIINMLLTRFIQRDNVSIPTIILTLCITTGAVVSIVFSPKQDADDVTVDVIIGMYRSWQFLVYSIITLILLIGLWSISRFYGKRNDELFRFCFPCFCGIVGGQNALFAKGTAKSIVLSFSKTTIDDRICLQYWEWYLLVITLICSIVLYLRWFNMGLKQFSPLHFYAIVTAFWILTVIMGGLVVFREIDDFDDSLSTVMFAVGSTVCIISMFGLSRVEPPRKRSPSRYEGPKNMDTEQTQIPLEAVIS